MRGSSWFLTIALLFAVATAAVFAGVVGADLIEERSARQTEASLEIENIDWVVVDVDGLLVKLTGVAESEAQRFAAITAASRVVDASRIIDKLEVVEPTPTAPEFSVEILRDGSDVSVIGLLPAALDSTHLLSLLRGDDRVVTSLLEEAEFAIPPGLETAADFAGRAGALLERSKISVQSNKIEIAAAVESEAEKSRLHVELARLASDSFILSLDITAPRPVIAPFTLRLTRNGDVADFDVCSADTQTAKDEILKAAVLAGLKGDGDCKIGLGSPSPSWSDAVTQSIRALAQIGEGSITFSDTDLTLIAADTTSATTFDTVIGELETTLPDTFSLHAVLTPRPKEKSYEESLAAPEFLATLSPEGMVQLRGRVSNDLMREAIEGFAKATFGSDNVYVATRTDGALPKGWPIKVMAALDALSHVRNGSVVVQPELLSLSGTTGRQGVRAEIAKLLTDKLGGAEDFDLKVTYSEALDPLAALPTPQECIDRIVQVQNDAKISFDPGKATIAEGGGDLMDKLAQAWVDCEGVPIEVSGHTDSQGRESMNLTLSQTRAEAVVDALLSRRVLTAKVLAKGYGETKPIADNGTEEGREANRRIEFRMIDEEALIEARRAELASDEGPEDEQN